MNAWLEKNNVPSRERLIAAKRRLNEDSSTRNMMAVLDEATKGYDEHIESRRITQQFGPNLFVSIMNLLRKSGREEIEAATAIETNMREAISKANNAQQS